MDGVSRDGELFIEGLSPEWIAFYADVQRLRAFNSLALHPAILGMFATLFGEKALAPQPQYLPGNFSPTL